jgi:outer membrane lipoprotein
MTQRIKRYDRQNTVHGLLFISLLLVVISGCVSPISREVRKEANENLEFTKVLQNPLSFRGVVVIWGGVIIKVVNHPGGSDLFLWETPLDLSGRPKGREYSEGEFIAKTSQSLDPQIYTSGRKISVAGEVTGEELGSYNNAPYIYPVIKIRESHLWKTEIPAINWEWGETPYYWPDEFNPDKEHRGPHP